MCIAICSYVHHFYIPGTLCEAFSPVCQNQPCLNNGTCQPSGDSFMCLCPLTSVGDRCQISFPCGNSPCQNNGVCRNTNETYTCQCPSHYTGRNCEIPLPCTSGPCVNGTCIDGADGDYSCECVPNYSGKNCDVQVLTCSKALCINGDCIMQDGIMQCVCDSGFTGEAVFLTFSSYHKKDRFKLDTVKVHDLHTNFTVHALSDRSTGNYFTMFLVVLNMH